MHVISLIETAPDKKADVLEEIRKITYKVVDNNGHEIENRVQVRELSLIDIVIQEKALPDVLGKLNYYLAAQSDKLVNKAEKLRKYISLFGGLDKIRVPKGGKDMRKDVKTTPIYIASRSEGRHCKLIPLGTMPDIKNEQGLDRL